jgi:CRISPR-associated protein Csh1
VLSTLLRIGEWQSQGKSEWDRFLEKPKVEYKDKNGNEIKNYMLPIVFDLDVMEVLIDKALLEEYREEMVEPLKALKIQGGNNKAIYVTVPPVKLNQIYKSFFGKENEPTLNGEMLEGIKKTDSKMLTEELHQILKDIFQLKENFKKAFTYVIDNNGVSEISPKAIDSLLKLDKNEKLLLLYVMIKASRYGINEPITFAQISDYEKFLTNKFMPEAATHSKNFDSSMKMCYASGEVSSGVNELKLSDRYSLNKMFVTETKNYATGFNEKSFASNYQVSEDNQEKLAYASTYLLKNLTITIANVNHVILPQLQTNVNVDLSLALTEIKRKSDLLFSLSSIDNFSKSIEDEATGFFWLNFIAYDSNGNFFKSTELIKDVSKFHFQNIIAAFKNIHWELKEESYLDWNNIMMHYGKSGWGFNFGTVYSMIPIRKDKEEKNKALILFKSILEKRSVKNETLFSYFKELALCHYYERYKSYTNIPQSSKDYFGKNIRDSVFKYLAFFEVLKILKLIDMEQINNPKSEESLSKYDQAIQAFFTKMNLNTDQQAMFFLGRMLNAVEWMQLQKKIKKTVINLVNFNGLDRDDIERLRNDLMNKARQHSQIGKVTFTNGKFGELFNYNNWKMSSTEALFFLLTGYSFGINVKDEEKRQEIEEELSE